MQTDKPILRASSGGRRGAGKPEVQLLGRLVSVFPVATVQLEFVVGTCPVLRLFSCSRERFHVYRPVRVLSRVLPWCCVRKRHANLGKS